MTEPGLGPASSDVGSGGAPGFDHPAQGSGSGTPSGDAEPISEPRAPSGPRPKTPPPPLMGRAPRPAAVRIRKPVVQAVVVGAALLVSGSLAWAFIIQPDLKSKARHAAEAERLEETRGGVRPSEKVTDQPASYDRLPEAQTLPEPRGLGAPPDPEESATPVRISQPAYGGADARGASAPSPASEAAASSLFFGPSASPNRSGGPAASPFAAQTATGSGRVDDGAIYSPHTLADPVSPYELKAGAIVPGVLLTGVDTARPGPVVAAVSQNVFDSITGRHLLLPQGTRVIGRHEGRGDHGDGRAFLVWDRLILPNGKSLVLTQEPGVDAQGAVGVPGRSDRRLWSLGVASLFAGAISTLGELARGRGEDRSLLGSAGDAASIEASQVGGRLIDRELQVRPSIRVGAGAPVHVMITRDLILEPYRP